MFNKEIAIICHKLTRKPNQRWGKRATAIRVWRP